MSHRRSMTRDEAPEIVSGQGQRQLCREQRRPRWPRYTADGPGGRDVYNLVNWQLDASIDGVDHGRRCRQLPPSPSTKTGCSSSAARPTSKNRRPTTAADDTDNDNTYKVVVLAASDACDPDGPMIWLP